MQIHLLVVEDEQPIREMLKMVLSYQNMTITEAENGNQAFELIKKETFDLVLLDWMLPDISGIEIAKRLKADSNTNKIPIIMLTAKGEEEDKIKGLECGADDYVTKPFSPKELSARIKAVLRRSTPTKDDKEIISGKITLDPKSHSVTISNTGVKLGPIEFKLLHFFMTHPNKVYSRTQLLDYVWGTNVFVEERTVDVHIRRLRKAVSIDGAEGYIKTIRGTGYIFSV